MALDDLLRYPEEEPASHRAVPPRRAAYEWIIKPVGYAVAGGVIGWLVLHAMGLSVPVPLAIMVVLASELLARTLKWIEVWPVPAGLRGGGQQTPADDGPADGLYLATARWGNRLAWARLQSDPEHFSRTLQPRLVQLVDERLWTRHGVSRGERPEQARAILGEPLWTFVTTPVRQSMTPRDLAALISSMEAL